MINITVYRIINKTLQGPSVGQNDADYHDIITG